MCIRDRDQTCERGDRCAEASDIYPEQQTVPVGGESGEQHRRRHIADHLAAEDGDKQAAPLHRGGERRADGGELADVSGEEEKTDKGEEQAVVHAAQQRPVEEKSIEQENQQRHRVRE